MFIYITKGFHTKRGTNTKYRFYTKRGTNTKYRFYTKRGTNTKYQVFIRKGVQIQSTGFIRKGVQIQSTGFIQKGVQIQSTRFSYKKGYKYKVPGSHEIVFMILKLYFIQNCQTSAIIAKCICQSYIRIQSQSTQNWWARLISCSLFGCGPGADPLYSTVYLT